MQISLAEKDDIDGILYLQTQIYRVSSLPQNSREILSKLIDSNYCDVLVAKNDKGQIVGSAFLFYLPIPAHGKPAAFLEGVVVDEKSRNQGFGTKITQKALELAKEKNAYKILFTSGFDREDIHKFYEKQGFKKWGYEFRMDLDK